MADESENLAIQILRQIQANLSEVQAKLELELRDLRARLRRLEERV